MSDSLRVTLVVWRDASADPPKRDRHVWTDVGQAYCWGRKPVWEWSEPDIDADCTPTVWCDPKPPGENAVTLDDLKLARHLLDTEMWHDEADRLRAALDAASAETEEA